MPTIDHLVVLMLENRSFDTFLGALYPTGPEFDGLTGTEWNPFHKPDGSVERIGVWNSAEMTPEAAKIPDPDPGELFKDINEQVFGVSGDPSGPARMDGFVDNYMRQPPARRPYDPRAVMHYFTATQVPATSQLAKAFGVSDRWFASAPCQTWPNRLFTHTGSAAGKVDNTAIPRPYFRPTVFRRLDRRGHKWRVYFHDFPQTAALIDLWPRLFTNFRLFAEFIEDAAAGTLPAYSFIEPRYLPGFLHDRMPNDGHPPHSIAYSEQLVAATYNALRASPKWDRTLFLLLFDEHGGCYDHVPPPPAVPPGPPYPDGFKFDRFGPRVPAVIASPWLPAGSVLRPPDEGAPFDHTSILATLHKLFDLGPAPTPRVAAAPDLLPLLSLPGPDNPGPERIDLQATPDGREEVREVRRLSRNSHQLTLLNPKSLIPGLIARGMGHMHGLRRGRTQRR